MITRFVDANNGDLLFETERPCPAISSGASTHVILKLDDSRVIQRTVRHIVHDFADPRFVTTVFLMP